ncbi:MAG: hypothetical protein ACE5IR_24240 [bacterium]
MKIKSFLDATSPFTDRRLRISSDDDPDTDENYGAGVGLSLEDDSEDDEREALNEDDSNTDDIGGSNEDKGDEDENSPTWKKRYDDTNESRKELKRSLDAALERLERLESAQNNKAGNEDLEELTRKYSEDLLNAVREIPEDDPERINKVYGAIARKMAEAQHNAVSRVRSESQESAEAQRRTERQRQEATELAEIALDEVGLDKTALPLFQNEVDAITKNNPNWFRAVPPQEQFISIARKVLSKVEGNKQKKHEHRKSAGGVLGPGSRVNKRSGAKDDDSEPDTLVGAMQLHRSNQRKDGLYRSKLANRI